MLLDETTASGDEYLGRVRRLPCCARSPECYGRVHAHHAGRRAGKNKAHDFTAIPLCQFHHGAWHACAPPFRWEKADRLAWADARIVETQTTIFGTDRMPPTGTDAVQGGEHPAWKGDEANTTTKRERTARRYELGTCERCLKPATERHHKDGDTGNNIPSNIEVLCRRCHMAVDGRLDALKAKQKRLAERQRKPPRQCRVCERVSPAKRMWKDRCHRCHEYWRRHGKERPWGARDAPRSEVNGRRKLTRDQAIEIRVSTETTTALARRYGVGRSTIWDIKTGKNWSSIK